MRRRSKNATKKKDYPSEFNLNTMTFCLRCKWKDKTAIEEPCSTCKEETGKNGGIIFTWPSNYEKS